MPASAVMSAAIGTPETAAVSKNDKNVILLKKSN
jgi:hypothetical protein